MELFFQGAVVDGLEARHKVGVTDADEVAQQTVGVKGRLLVEMVVGEVAAPDVALGEGAEVGVGLVVGRELGIGQRAC